MAERQRGRVAIASKPFQKSGRPAPDCPTLPALPALPALPGFKRFDITSEGTAKLAPNVFACDVSPLLLGPVADFAGEQCVRFENLWQYSKVYPQLGHWDAALQKPTPAWYAWRADGFGRLRGGKGIRTPSEVYDLKQRFGPSGWKPLCSWWNGRALGYLEARRTIFVSVYARALRKHPAMVALREKLDAGKDILLLDVDGPSIRDYPNGRIMDAAVYKDALSDTAHIFGHGYVVAAILANVI